MWDVRVRAEQPSINVIVEFCGFKEFDFDILVFYVL